MLRGSRWMAVALLLPVSAAAQTPAQEQVRQRLGSGGLADTTTAVALSAAFRGAAERALPAVVHIIAERAPIAMQREQMPQLPPPFRDMLPQPQGPTRGSGSGVIVDSEGHILTNNHVVADASQLTVRLVDGREYRARVIGGNISTDIAVIKIDPAEGETLPTAVLGDSENVRVGDWVLTIVTPVETGVSIIVSSSTICVVMSRTPAIRDGVTSSIFRPEMNCKTANRRSKPLKNPNSRIPAVSTTFLNRAGSCLEALESVSIEDCPFAFSVPSARISLNARDRSPAEGKRSGPRFASAMLITCSHPSGRLGFSFLTLGISACTCRYRMAVGLSAVYGVGPASISNSTTPI